MLRTMISMCILAVAGIAGVAPAACSDDWYFHDGPLAGSLKSDQPLPLYDKDPNHLWNRLFAAIYIRPSEIAGRPEHPKDTTELDQRDRKLRSGTLPPDPVVKRVEGGDVMEFLAWPRTRYYSEPATFGRINKLLDEFLATNAEKLITDPLKRAFLQHDLWAVFDHLAGQTIARFGDADLARRRAVVPSHLTSLVGEKEYDDDKEVFGRRETMCRKLAVIIQRLALPKAALEALPDNYAAAIRSGHFASEHQFDTRLDYLPTLLLMQPNEWVEIDAWPGTIGEQREGQLTLHSASFRARSYFRVFWRFPGGRREVEAYLDYLRREGVDWQQVANQGFLTLKGFFTPVQPGLKQIPLGTQAALVQFLMALDDQLQPVPTPLAGEVRLRVYKNVDGSPDAETNTGRGMNVYWYPARRRLLFDGLKHGGLEREPDDMPTYRVFLQEGVIGAQDWGRYGRQQSVAQSCLHCHMFQKEAVGVYSMFGHVSAAPGLESRAVPGIGVPMGSGPVRVYPRGVREARWKVRQEEYLRLVEYAHSAPPARVP